MNEQGSSRISIIQRLQAGTALTSRSSESHVVILVLAAACLLRAFRGFQGFPYVDDYIYIPVALAKKDPGLFARDLFVTDFALHKVLFPELVQFLTVWTGLPLGYLILTVLMSIASVALLWQMMRSTELSLFVLPIYIACCFNPRPEYGGIGRGLYGGFLADTFHYQWVALLGLLLSYYFFSAGKCVWAGVVLGLVAQVNAAVAAHGAIAFTFCGLCSSSRSLRELLTTAFWAVVGALPFLIDFFKGGSFIFADVPALPPRDTYLFRLPHEYSLIGRNDLGSWKYFFVVITGLLGYSNIPILKRTPFVRRLFCLFLGQTIILMAFLFCHVFDTRLFMDQLSGGHFLLHLSRTSTLTLFLAMFFALTAGVYSTGAVKELFLTRDKSKIVHLAYLMGLLLVMSEIVLAQSFVNLLLCAFALLLYVEGYTRRAIYLGQAVIVLSLAYIGIALEREAPVPSQQQELFSWVKQHTAKDALFIIPPGFQEFRLYALRGAYVDFKTFPMTVPRLYALWRSRLEEIARPTEFVINGAVGWEGLWQWDHSYALHNNERRVADLLQETGADYLVYDRSLLRLPPIVLPQVEPDSRVIVAYENETYQVFKRSRSQ